MIYSENWMLKKVLFETWQADYFLTQNLKRCEIPVPKPKPLFNFQIKI